MRAKEQKLLELLKKENIQFTIPVFQRNYSWEVEHCEQLLLDIKEVGNNNQIINHFIGSIIYLEGKEVEGLTELIVVDGQQRLTTFFLIFLTMLKIVRSKEPKDENFEKCILSFLINKDFSNKFKIKHFNDIDITLHEIWLNLDKHKYSFNRNTRNCNLVDNFEYFVREINDKDIELIWKGLEKLILIEVQLNKDRDDAQRIFQSMNTTGLELSQADIIRNYIMLKLSDVKQQYLINDIYWEPMQEVLITNSGGKKDIVSMFIRDFLTLVTERIPNQKQVYVSFKKYFDSNLDKGALLLRYSVAYGAHT
ncbi:MAG: DUF262 domain-containing protein [Bacteroidia bacterium]|nr:DUF262 domain-containing protein [Bacteroidia bacterium]